MINHDFINLKCPDGTSMDAYVSIPENGNVNPALLLFQEAFGVTQHIRNVAERLCSEGYVVIAPDLYHRTAKRIEVPYTDFASADPHRQAITLEGLKVDLNTCFGWLKDNPGVQKDRVGSIGFCMGGRVAYYSNSILPLAASVSYYGGGIDLLTGMAKQLHGPQLFFWGGLDKHVTEDKVASVINALKTAGKEYTSVTVSYADHGFNCDERTSYHPLAAKEAWAHTIAFLKNRLLV
ncbi:MAG: dienelactone hydrolase family protein [Chitinophagaceae bacterium]|nr:dienelactone hydrolase family protein [Chitinophagaceae bacterium]